MTDLPLYLVEPCDFYFVFPRDGLDLGSAFAGKVAGQPATCGEFTGHGSYTRVHPSFAARPLE
jgi:hypothetical protein